MQFQNSTQPDQSDVSGTCDSRSVLSVPVPQQLLGILAGQRSIEIHQPTCNINQTYIHCISSFINIYPISISTVNFLNIFFSQISPGRNCELFSVGCRRNSFLALLPKSWPSTAWGLTAGPQSIARGTGDPSKNLEKLEMIKLGQD